MKKVISYLFIPAIILASASCCTVQVQEEPAGTAVTTISAYMDELPTKTTYLVDNVAQKAIFSWMQGDLIDVVIDLGSASTGVSFTAQEDGPKVVFKDGQVSGLATVESLKQQYPGAKIGSNAFYPSRNDAVAQENGYGIDWEINGSGETTVTLPEAIAFPVANPLSIVPLYGVKDDSGEFGFTPMTSVLAIPVKNLTADMDFISISHGSAALSGAFSLQGGKLSQGSALSSPGHSLRLSFSGLEGDYTFYFPVASGSIPAGLEIRCGKSSDTDAQMVLVSKNAITLNHGCIGRCGEITFTPIDQQWADFATGLFKDDFIWSQHGWNSSTWIPVTIQRSGLHPEKYRIANPYAAACTSFGYSPYTAGIKGDDYFVYFIDGDAVSYQNMKLGMEDKASNGKPLMISYRSANSAYTHIVSTLTDGTILELQFAAFYSDPDNSGYFYTKDNFDGTPKIHLKIDNDTPETWNSIGTAQFIDNFVWPYAGISGFVEREIQQFSHNANRFRIARPYPADDADEWFEFNVSDPSKVTSVNYYTGVTVSDETKTDVTWKAVVWNGAYGYDYSNVISTQANGLPLEVQIGPCYRDSEGIFTSTYNYDYEVGKDHQARVIDIIFPHPEETWTSIGTGRYRDEYMWKNCKFAPYDVEVEVYRSDLDPNRYRINNPYTVANTAFKRTAAGDGDEYMYLTVDTSTGYVTFGSVITGMSNDLATANQTKNFAIADAPTWESIKSSGSAISAAASKVIAGTNDNPSQIQLYSVYYDSANVGYFYTNNTLYKYLWFPGAYLAGETWNDYCDGTYQDGLYDTKINNSVSSTLGTVAVKIQQSSVDANRFRVSNPYRENLSSSLLCSTYDEYLYFQTGANDLVWFDTFRPGIVFDSSPKELGIVHPVYLNFNYPSRGTSIMSYSKVSEKTSEGAPKTVNLGPFYFDIATPNAGYNYPRFNNQYPAQTIFITFDVSDKAVVTPRQYPMISSFNNPVEILSLPNGTLEKLVVKIEGLTDLSKVSGLNLYQNGWMCSGYVAPDANGVVTFTEFSNATVSGDIDINCWLTDVELGVPVTFRVTEAVVDGVSLPVKQDLAPHFAGKVVNNGGDAANVRGSSETISSFRIPALVTSNAGTLVAAYDIRYQNSGDLQGDIDVGVKRSTDGGHTWSDLINAMDMGEYGGLDQYNNGIGDPCLLVDENTGDIFCFAVWAHGHYNDSDSRTLAWAGTGFEILDTPQFMMAKSSDDGLTWGEPVNLTLQIKKSDWRMTFQGPGRGITMKDGTLVIPIQHQEGDSRIMHGLYPLNSGIAYSTDHGLTWHAHNYAHAVTSEACVAEIEPGVLLLSMRDETDSRYRRAFTTTDLGRSWQAHSSNGKVVEPTCEASMLHIDASANNLGQDILLLSNPNSSSGRQNISIRASLDKGVTWDHTLLLDSGGSLGYSCLTQIDRDSVGILYESSQAHMTFQAVKLKDIR